MKQILLIVCLATTLALPTWAGTADVLEVNISATGPQTYTFEVTVQHADTGWKHYADQWQVLAPDGTVLGTRVLHHPHEQEQPFTRSLSGVQVPPHIDKVTVRARDSKHSWGGKSLTLELPRKE